MTTQNRELNYNDSEDDILGRGSCGRFVFRGSFGPDRMPVAVKRIQRVQVNSDSVQKEVELMKKARHHPNILRFIHTEISKDNYFLLIVTEKCSGTLKDYVENVYQGPRFVSEWEMLRQMTKGLEHLHRLGIVHRDIKPTNILIFEPEGDSLNLLLKLADFSISKALQPNRDNLTNTNVANPNGTKGWMAPEVYQLKRIDFKVDIFALGLIFGYVLTGGNHPFGEKSEDRISRKEPMLIVRKDLKEPYSKRDSGTFKLIKSMLKMNPLKRPTITEVKGHLWGIADSINLFDWGRTMELWNICCSAVINEDELNLFHQLVNDPTVDIHGVMPTNNKSTPLHWLCEYCQNDNLKDLVRLLIQKGADVNAKDDSGSTPLRYLCSNYDKDNQVDIVQFFIQNVDFKNSNECTELLVLLCRKYNNNDLIDNIRALVENGADANAKVSDRWTPLHYVCRYYQNDNLIDIVQLLVEKGAEVNTKTEYGWTPLHSLCFNYKNDNLRGIIQLFLRKDADVNAKTTDGWTPLHFLCYNYKNDNLPGIIQLIFKKDADVNAKTTDGCTPLHFLCYNYKNDNLPGIIELFLGKDADVNAKDKHGLTPLHSLCFNYQNENLPGIIKLFLRKDADVNAKTTDGWTPLLSLCRGYRNDNLLGIIKLFLEKDADVNVKNKHGLTPLHSLCFNYQNENLPDIIKLFLEKDADVNAEATDGWTTLHFLCCYHEIDDSIKEDNLKRLINLLVANGASMDAKINKGISPNDIMQIRRKKTMLAIEPVTVDIPEEPLTKDEYEIGSASTQS